MQEGSRMPAKCLAVGPGWDKPQRRPVIWINGWPGVGKASVAGLLSMLIGIDKSIVVAEDANDDSNPTPTFEPRRDPRHSGQIQGVSEMLEDLSLDPEAARRAIAMEDHILDPASFAKFTIITACQTATERGAKAAAQYAAAARRANRLFVPVTLVCETRENIRRLQTRHAAHPAHHEPGPQDPKEDMAERGVGLYEFSHTPGPSLPPSPCSPGPQLENVGYDGHRDGTETKDDDNHDEDHVSEDDPAALTICVDVTRKTSMEAGFTILQHVEEMEERRLRRERAAAWAAAETEAQRVAAEAEAKSRKADDEAARRTTQRQASYGHATAKAHVQGPSSDGDPPSSPESPVLEMRRGGANATGTLGQAVVDQSFRDAPRRRSA
ncbi:hypothetical protein MAPG_00450 [Magnaporthiopsis poae ATCC 64411]|uniref:Uncharacterized protein n=1 Tax=Magnaporthiopsis poae (strain ATCC 64411 / 73-15) TaxID=644358 RepID=A0A0C4DL16_MAGP6|nr:hypothetical protein MAPG_00450 [Magnaporthiopsis poae ATCC 64411]